MCLKLDSEEIFTDTHKSFILAKTKVYRLQLPLSICYCLYVLTAYWSYYHFLTGVPLFDVVTWGDLFGLHFSSCFVSLSVTSSM